MVPNSLNQSRESKSRLPVEHLGDLKRAIDELRETLTNQPQEMTTAFLVRLETDIEAVAAAIKEERWAREGQEEFLGE